MPQPIKEYKSEEDEMTLKEFIQVIGKYYRYLLFNWKLIVLVSVIGGILGFIYAYKQKPIYVAELSFALEDEQAGGIGGALGLASQFGLNLGNSSGGAFSGDNLIELMKSRAMVEKTLLAEVNVKGRKQTLADFFIDFNGYRKKWGNQPELIKIHFLANVDRNAFTRQQDSLLGKFYETLVKNNLSVAKVDKKLSIISVKVLSADEIFSKYFTERLVKEVSDFYVETKTKKSVENLAILQHQTDSVKRALNSAISGVATSVDGNLNLNPAYQVLRVPSQRKQFDVQANQAILTELVKNLEISKISLRRETPLIQVIDKPIFPLLKIVVSKVKSFLIGSIFSGLLIALILIVKKKIKELGG